MPVSLSPLQSPALIQSLALIVPLYSTAHRIVLVQELVKGLFPKDHSPGKL